jgi:O-antigen/teichoic acid export membrane protein
MEIKEKIQYLIYAKGAAVLNIVLVVLVLKFTGWGLMGVALSTGLSNFIKIYYIYFFMKRVTGIKLNVLEVTKTAITLAPFAATAVALSNLENPTLRLLLPGALGFLVLYIMYRLIQPFNIEEKGFSNQLVSKLPARFSFISKALAFNS